ncbi:Uncharacterised protein [Vibrio cholerae]|nr:Uncharacterised protein [Vibrio cholerae]
MLASATLGANLKSVPLMPTVTVLVVKTGLVIVFLSLLVVRAVRASSNSLQFVDCTL